MVSLRGCFAALLSLALRGEAALSWVKAGTAAQAMCAGIHEACSDMASCTKVAVGPCGGLASPPFWFEITTEGLALVKDDDTSYLSNPSTKLQELTPSSHRTNGYRYFGDNLTAGTGTYATIANGAYFGSDPNDSGGYVGMAAYVLQSGTIKTNEVEVMVPDEYGESKWKHKSACISEIASGACGPDITFTEGAFKYSYMGASTGSNFNIDASVKYLGIRSKLTLENFTGNMTYLINGDKTADTIGTADVTTLTARETSGQKREMKIDFPLKYNVGSLANLKVPNATRTVKIKVSKVPNRNDAIYVDYLFDAADFQTKDKWFLYDPTAREQVPGSTSGGSNGGNNGGNTGSVHVSGATKTKLTHLVGAFLAMMSATFRLL